MFYASKYFVRHNVYCVSKNDTDVARYKFNGQESIFVIFGRDIAE